MDHAFGFKTYDVRSSPNRYLLSFFFVFFSFLFFFFFFYLQFGFCFYFLIKHEILFTNFARAECECMFSFVSFTMDTMTKKYMYIHCGYEPCEKNDYIKKQ